MEPQDLTAELSRVNLAVVERRGVRSFGPPPADEVEARALDHYTAERGGVDKVERVDDVVAAIVDGALDPSKPRQVSIGLAR